MNTCSMIILFLTTILQTGSYVAHKAIGIEQNCVLYQETTSVIQGVFAFNQQVLLDERVLSVMFRRKLRTLGKGLKENSLQRKA